MSRHLVIVGGGHAHMTVLLRLQEYVQRGHRVTVIGPSPYHYYSGMGPGMLGGTYRPQDIRFHVRKMAEDRGAAFVQDAVVRVDAVGRTLHLRSGERVRFDVASFNTGSVVPVLSRAADGVNAFTVKPITSLLLVRKAVLDVVGRKQARIVVVGGGPAGVEIAGNLWRLVQAAGHAQITLLAGRELLGGLPARAQRIASRSLTSRGIAVREGVYANTVETDAVMLSNGTRLPADVAIIATGVRPSTIFRDSNLPTGPDGGLLVDRYLQCVDHPGIFGGGDCISFGPRPLDKVGVFAVRQNDILFRNLQAALEGSPLERFWPQRSYLLIFNLGDGTGIMLRNGLFWNGRLPWLLKDRIDRSFMRRFQVSGERDEVE